jgi:hypothetical protein
VYNNYNNFPNNHCTAITESTGAGAAFKSDLSATYKLIPRASEVSTIIVLLIVVYTDAAASLRHACIMMV